MLAWTIYLSFAGALALLGVPERRVGLARCIALATSAAGAAVAAVGVWGYSPADGLLTVCRVPWIPSLGIQYHLAADGISLTLVLLTGIAAVAGVLFSWNITHRVKEYFAFYLVLIAGVYGVFLSLDLFLLFVFYELAIIPKYFLIAIWGSTNREYGAMKLALYSFVGSALVLIGIVAAYVVAGSQTMGLLDLSRAAFSREFQLWAFPLVFVGFGVLAGLWPFHTWAPTGHVAAPTAASMLLAGVIMKLGAYGALRVAMTLFPLGLEAWRGAIGALAVIGIVAGALVALAQKDFKFVIGYSSVSHMGFVLLGLATATEVGLNGAVLQMFSHGVIAGLLFGVVGRMVYERTHTRNFDDLGRFGLGRALPFAAFTFVVGSVASMGLPGFSGFVAELQILIGAWRAFPWLCGLGGLGVVIGVAYTLRAWQRSFFADEAAGAPPPGPLEPISWPERIGAALLMLSTLIVGLYPAPLMDLIASSWRLPMFDALWKGGGL